jgi:hypothetical protein
MVQQNSHKLTSSVFKTIVLFLLMGQIFEFRPVDVSFILTSIILTQLFDMKSLCAS